MDTSRYISMCTDRDTVFEVCQYLPGGGGWVCYPQGMRDTSMGLTLMIQNPVLLPGFYHLWVLCAVNVSPAKACTAFECICFIHIGFYRLWVLCADNVSPAKACTALSAFVSLSHKISLILFL